VRRDHLWRDSAHRIRQCVWLSKGDAGADDICGSGSDCGVGNIGDDATSLVIVMLVCGMRCAPCVVES
jgi:hypothetical protein